MKPVVLVLGALLAIGIGVGAGLLLRPADSPKLAGPTVAAGIDTVAQEVLTPGGAYTQADIDANGNVSPFDKYARTMIDPGSAHHKPQIGDMRCPITGSAGNITWIIAGRTYYFCCCPCIIEYVKLAKAHPEQLQPPEDFMVTAENIDSLPEPTM